MASADFSSVIPPRCRVGSRFPGNAWDLPG